MWDATSPTKDLIVPPAVETWSPTAGQPGKSRACWLLIFGTLPCYSGSPRCPPSCILSPPSYQLPLFEILLVCWLFMFMLSFRWKYSIWRAIWNITLMIPLTQYHCNFCVHYARDLSMGINRERNNSSQNYTEYAMITLLSLGLLALLSSLWNVLTAMFLCIFLGDMFKNVSGGYIYRGSKFTLGHPQT